MVSSQILTTDIKENIKEEESKHVYQTQSNSSTYFRTPILWQLTILQILLHVLFLLGTVPAVLACHNATILFGNCLGLCTALFGIQLGAHRFYSHRSFRANLPLRFLMVAFQTMALQQDLVTWVRNHRLHHRYCETDADPTNSKRGFFFSHIGWTMLYRHPEMRRKVATVDLSDLTSDSLVRHQRKYYYVLWMPVFWFALPLTVPVLCWGESLWASFLICVIVRTTLILHLSGLGNSWAHAWGARFYKGKLAAVEMSIRHVLMGEGFHNFHHAIPWDYSASELGPAYVFNPATALIDFFAAIGWAWDRKKADPKLVEKVAAEYGEHLERLKSGDQYHPRYRTDVVSRVLEYVSGVMVVMAILFSGMLAKYAYFRFIQNNDIKVI